MASTVNIIISVDVAAALSGRTLEGNIWLMDDGIFESTRKGTPHLTTNCKPGQLIIWTAYAVDVQTPIGIKDISFLCPCDSTPDEEPVSTPSHKTENLDLNAWEGWVPYTMAIGQPNHYRLTLQMGEGENSTMQIDTSSIMRVG